MVRSNIFAVPCYEVITLVNVKAPEVTYNALESDFFRTGAGKMLYRQSLKCMSEHISTLFMITNGARTIDAIAVYGMTSNFVNEINLIFLRFMEV